MHGEPNGLIRLSSAHVSTMLEKPMSLPPMPMVTSVVPELSALNCGGFVPRATGCGCVMSAVVAPAQLMLVNEDAPTADATSAG